LIHFQSSLRLTGGTTAQAIPIAIVNPINIGCNSATPAAWAITPVMAGKIVPPACAVTKMMPTLNQQKIMLMGEMEFI
jgi:hypothetical protein